MFEKEAQSDIISRIYRENFGATEASGKQKRGTGLSPQNRLLVIVVIVGCIGVVAGIVRIFYGIQKPVHNLTRASNPAGSSVQLGFQDFESSVLGAVGDIDGDGLSDGDEQNIYYTSPYLADSDSDGVSDYDEVRQGTDPNCVPGKNCFRTPTEEPSSFGTVAGTVTVTESSAEQGVNAALLRELLEKSGMDKALLDALSDEDIMAEYQKFLSQTESQETQANVSQDVKNLTPPQIRALLKQNGISQEILDSFSDSELTELVQEVGA